MPCTRLQKSLGHYAGKTTRFSIELSVKGSHKFRFHHQQVFPPGFAPERKVGPGKLGGHVTLDLFVFGRRESFPGLSGQSIEQVQTGACRNGAVG